MEKHFVKVSENMKNLYGIIEMTRQFVPTKGYGNQKFIVISDKPLTEEIAKTLQLEANFHPAGYGFYWSYRNLSFVPDKNGNYYTTWSCSNSCD